jgi:hypothetical protein
LIGELEGNGTLARPRTKQVDNIKIDLAGIGLGGVDWTGLAQDMFKRRPIVNAVMNFLVP